MLFDALGCSGAPPLRPIEFDSLLNRVLAERPRVLVCDEAQWLCWVSPAETMVG